MTEEGKPGLRALPTDQLDLRDAPQLIWIRVKDAVRLLWKENPKLHDIGSVVSSISRHGFQEIPKYDKHIGIKAGNGRVEALAWMESQGGYDLPRGLALFTKTGEWVMPLLIGTDAKSRDLARSYAIDSNNLTLGGGDFTALDAMRLWDQQGYLRILASLAKKGQLPESVDGDDLDYLSFVSNFNPLEDVFGLDVSDALQDEVLTISVSMPPKNFEPVVTAIRQLVEENPEWGVKIR